MLRSFSSMRCTPRLWFEAADEGIWERVGGEWAESGHEGLSGGVAAGGVSLVSGRGSEWWEGIGPPLYGSAKETR